MGHPNIDVTACPVCGEKVPLWIQWDLTSHRYHLRCQNCYHNGKQASSKYAAKIAWNKEYYAAQKNGVAAHD